MRYKKGVDHGNADGPSRNPVPATAADAEEEERDRLLHAYSLETHEYSRLEALATGEYLELCTLLLATLQGGGRGGRITGNGEDDSSLRSPRLMGALRRTRPDYVIVGAGTEVVAQQLRKVQKQRGFAALSLRAAAVPTRSTSACAVTAAPSAAMLASAAIKGMHLFLLSTSTPTATSRIYSA